MRAIVADASPLIALARSGLLGALHEIAGEILAPQAVWTECTADILRPGAAALLTARDDGLIFLRDAPWRGDPLPALGQGELAAIALALELSCPLLMDERIGRRVAALQGARVIGSAGILLIAKQRGLVAAVRPVLEEWRGWGYFLSEDLMKAVLAQAEEV
jgi:uncharacterized protein